MIIRFCSSHIIPLSIYENFRPGVVIIHMTPPWRPGRSGRNSHSSTGRNKKHLHLAASADIAFLQNGYRILVPTGSGDKCHSLSAPQVYFSYAIFYIRKFRNVRKQSSSGKNFSIKSYLFV